MKKTIVIFVLAAMFAACNGASKSKAPVVDSSKTIVDTTKK